jgi:hypothetical protein
MASEDYDEPFGWWGWHWQPPVPLSVVQLIEARSFDAPLMALLWTLLAHRASIIVGAEPPMAGKTTTLTALLDFLPPTTRKIYLRGHYENFEFTRDSTVEPARTYLLANEMSDHLAIYFWGARVGKLFSLLPEGYAFGSTMHAETVEDVLAILQAPPLHVPDHLLGRLTVVVNLQLIEGVGRTTRRCIAVHLVQPGSGPRGVDVTCLARWDRATDSVQHYVRDDPAALAALSRWLCLPPAEVTADLARRESCLTQLITSGARSIPAVRRALSKF